MKMHSHVMRPLAWALIGGGLLLSSANATAAPAQTAAANLQTSIVAEIPLWPGVAPGSENAPTAEKIEGDIGRRAVSAIAHPAMTAYFASNPNGAAVLVMPGGGYVREVFDKEGGEIARWLNTLGIDAFVLKYRLPDEGHKNGRDVPLQDAQRALRLIRAGDFAEDTGHRIDPKRIGVMGFSAGGHLAVLAGTYYGKQIYTPVDAADVLNARPDFIVLAYTPVPGDFRIHGASSERDALFTSYPIGTKVTAQTPPAFIFAGDKDERVPYEHSQRLGDMLRKAGVPAEVHIFPGAPHGFALRGKGEEKAWPELCAAWLRARGVIPSAPQ